MKALRNLIRVVMIPIVAFALNGCIKHREYHYDGKLDSEYVEFLELGNVNRLRIEMKNNRGMLYLDRDNDFGVDEVHGYLRRKSGDKNYETIWIQNGSGTHYNLSSCFSRQKFYSEDGKGLMERQKEFINYLSKIKDLNSDKR